MIARCRKDRYATLPLFQPYPPAKTRWTNWTNGVILLRVRPPPVLHIVVHSVHMLSTDPRSVRYSLLLLDAVHKAVEHLAGGEIDSLLE